MQYTKDIPLSQREQPMYREHHLALGMLVLLGVSAISSDQRPLGAIQAFSTLLSVPVLSIICGKMSRQLEESWQTVRMSAFGFAALFAGSTMPGFWMAALAREQVSFDLLSPAYPTSLFLFIALALPISFWIEERRLKRGLVLAVSVVLGAAAGYVPWVPNPLGLRQLVSFLPLFLIGRWVNPHALERLERKVWLKAAGAAVLAALLLGSFWQWKRLLEWDLVLMGGDAYASMGASALSVAGGVLRLGQYACALVAAFALLSLCPERRMGRLTELSRRWYAGLFWHRGMACFLAVFLRRGAAVVLARTALAGVLPVLVCIPLGAVLPNWLLDLPQNLSDQTSILKIKKRRGMSLSLVLYLLTFLLVLSQFASSFVATGHTMTWVPDGENLYIVMMYYARNYFIGVAKTLFHTGKLVFPQWDFSIGQGASVLSVLKLNPFYLLAFFFPRRWMDSVYSVYVLAQLLCAGLAFSALCRRLGQKDELAVYTGSLLYSFSGYCIFAAAKHVYFVTYLVLGLPLLLLGCERFLQQRKWGVFVAVVAFLFMGGYYYTWMDSLLMAIYLLARELHLHKGETKTIVRHLVELVALYLWGMAVSMVVLLPSIASLFTSSRSDTLGNGAALLYAPVHYAKLVTNLCSLDPTAQNWTRLGFVGTAFLALVVLFLPRKGREMRPFRVLSVLSLVFLCLPAAGSVFNGMGYATNRWSFGLALLMAMIFVWMLPDLVRLEKREQQIVTAVSLVYLTVSLVLNHDTTAICSALLFLALLLTLLFVNRLNNERLAQQLLCAATAAALLVHVGYYFSPMGLNNVDDYTELGSGAAKYSSSAESAMTGLEKELYRGEHNGNRHNTFCLTGGNGTSTYWSVLDGTMVDYHLDFELDSLHQLYAIWGLDQRASLCALGSVKYYTSKTPDQVPFGFEETGKSKSGKHTLFKNKYALPFGYTYNSYLPEIEYNSLSPLEKQQAILQSAVVTPEVKEKVASALMKGEPEVNTQSLEWKVKKSNGVEWKDNTFHVTKKNGSIVLKFEGKEDCETYLWLKGAKYTDGASESTLTVKTGTGGDKKSDLYQKNTLYYFQRSGYTYNLGYNKKPLKACKLVFEQAGNYTMEDVQIICLPMKDYVRDVTALGEQVLQDVYETPNGGLTGKIEVKEPRLLTFSVPWSKGWKLKVNGERAELLQVNGMYMGTLLEPGSYEVELHYTIPGLIPGAVVSALALLSLAGYGAAHIIRRRNRR